MTAQLQLIVIIIIIWPEVDNYETSPLSFLLLAPA